MLALLLSTLFAASACLALAAIGSSWRSYGAAVLELRRQLAECGRSRELRFALVSTTVRKLDEPAGATVYRPSFRPVAMSLAWQPELRAAA